MTSTGSVAIPRLLRLALLLFILLPARAAAQPAAAEADVESVDAIIGALYDVISGPVGQARDWDRMRSLFIPGARLIPTGRRPDGAGVHRVLTVEEYITMSGPTLVELGFRETEMGRVTERFGNIVHAFSSYQAFRGTEAEPFMRGINSIQLWYDTQRWWVVTVFWQQESDEHPIPARYLTADPPRTP